MSGVQFGLEIAMKSSLVLGAAAAVASLLERPTSRLLVWRGVLVTLLLLPGLVLLLPTLSLPLLPAANAPVPAPILAEQAGLGAISGSSDASLKGLSLMGVVAYLIGAALAVLGLARGMVGLRRLFVAARPAIEHPVPDVLNRVGSAIGLDRPVAVRWSADVASPLGWGWRRPRVLLPVGWCQVPSGILSAALAHELVHLRRADWPWMLLGRFAGVLYWWHPGVRWLVRRMLNDCELACDETTLSLGLASRSNYARALLHASQGAPGSLALAMAGSSIRQRVEHLINPPLAWRSPMNIRQTLLVAALVPLLSIPLAACQVTRASEDAPTPPQAVAASRPDSLAVVPDVATAPRAAAVAVPRPDPVVTPRSAPAPVASPSPAMAPRRVVRPSASVAPAAAPVASPVIAAVSRARLAEAARQRAEVLGRQAAVRAEAAEGRVAASAERARLAAVLAAEAAELESQVVRIEATRFESERAYLQEELARTQADVARLEAELERLRRGLEGEG